MLRSQYFQMIQNANFRWQRCQCITTHIQNLRKKNQNKSYISPSLFLFVFPYGIFLRLMILIDQFPNRVPEFYLLLTLILLGNRWAARVHRRSSIWLCVKQKVSKAHGFADIQSIPLLAKDKRRKLVNLPSAVGTLRSSFASKFSSVKLQKASSLLAK